MLRLQLPADLTDFRQATKFSCGIEAVFSKASGFDLLETHSR
jgi:hypothetical protein